MKKAIFFMTCVILLVSAGMANADTLYLGGTFNSIYLTGAGLANPVGGGSIAGSKLNGTLLPYDFCIGLYTDVYVPGTYSAIVTNNGTVNNGQSVTNAGEIAYLLTNYASPGMSSDAQIALQAAIWSVEYSGVALDSTHYAGTTILTDYNTEIAAASGKSAPLTGFDWMTPYTVSNGIITYDQAQVTATPEPCSLLLVVGFAFGLYGIESFRKKVRTS